MVPYLQRRSTLYCSTCLSLGSRIVTKRNCRAKRSATAGRTDLRESIVVSKRMNRKPVRRRSATGGEFWELTQQVVFGKVFGFLVDDFELSTEAGFLGFFGFLELSTLWMKVLGKSALPRW